MAAKKDTAAKKATAKKADTKAEKVQSTEQKVEKDPKETPKTKEVQPTEELTVKVIDKMLDKAAADLQKVYEDLDIPMKNGYRKARLVRAKINSALNVLMR